MISFESVYFDDTPCEGRIVDIFPAFEASHDISLFFIHGGGWRGGSRTIYHQIIHEYRKRGLDCASTDYRLKGVTVFEQVSDIRIGLDIFAADLAKRNRPQKVILMGCSAGAHLSLLTALTKPEEGNLPASHCEISGVAVQAAAFTFEPWPDIFPAIWSSMQNAAGASYEDAKERFQAASPLHHVRPGNPPVFVLHAENEHMFPHELYTEFAGRYTACGNSIREKIYPSTEHGFFYSLERWQQREAFEDILKFAEELEH